MKRACLIAGLCIVLAAGAVLGTSPGRRLAAWLVYGLRQVMASPMADDPRAGEEYERLRQEIGRMRAGFAARYASAGTPRDRGRVLAEAREAVQAVLVGKVFPLWRGTRTDYNGTTQVPRNGEIACGFLVATILDHLGFGVERTALARSPALAIIKALSSPAGRITVAAGQPVDKLAEALEKAGHGAYVIGLDHHVGFLVYDADGMRIYHAGSSRVVREDIRRCYAILYESGKGKFLGRLFEDHMMEAWITGHRMPCRECGRWSAGAG